MSISSIKITALNNIGNSIAYTTLVPVVNMAGTPTTEKANLQILGNLILSGAGGSYFAPAAQAVNAQTVSNAAQPAITSVGTLTGLTVGGVSNLGPVANVTITGGTAGYVLSTNGSGVLSWAVPSSSSGNVNSAGGGYVDNAVTRYDGTSGNIIQNSLVTIADDGAISSPNNTGSMIPFYYSTLASFPAAASSHGAVAHAHDTGKLYYAHAGLWIELANITDITPGTSGFSGFSGIDGASGFSGFSGIDGASGFSG
jgi:hypothetical protein